MCAWNGEGISQCGKKLIHVGREEIKTSWKIYTPDWWVQEGKFALKHIFFIAAYLLVFQDPLFLGHVVLSPSSGAINHTISLASGQ